MNGFHGAKLAILVRDRIVTILRDDCPGIPWPGYWDLPGGAREGNETPEDCVLRELREELGLNFKRADLHWSHASRLDDEKIIWFFVSEQPNFDPDAVLFGAEGQEWRLVASDWFLTSDRVIPRHTERLKIYLNQRSGLS